MNGLSSIKILPKSISEYDLKNDTFRRKKERIFSSINILQNILTQNTGGDVVFLQKPKFGSGRIIPSKSIKIIFDQVSFGKNFVIYCKNETIFPKDTTIDDYVILMDRDLHGVGSSQKELTKPITFLRNELRIGRHSVVLKGAMIDQCIPDYSVVSQSKVIVPTPEYCEKIDRAFSRFELSPFDPFHSLIVVGDSSLVSYDSFDDCPGFNCYPNAFIYVGARVKIGHHTFFNFSSVVDSSNGMITIGNYCSIGFNCLVGVDSQTSIFHKETILEDQVWLGGGSIIERGVRIGRGSIIAAGSYVDKDVEPYSVYGGRPANLISKISPFVGSHGGENYPWCKTF